MISSKNPSNNGWWRGGVIYQIYPRSFQDSNGDGIGDLSGIQQRLGYVAELGVDGIWLSPFFKSPMKDFGYDVSDYCDVDPMFGTLDDFKAVLKQAHALGLKVMIDQVLSHTSDQHPWFAESRTSRDNPKADWYVWADAKDDGTPPNNWLSIFGGSAWQWDTRRCQYYLHNFLASQPDLNFHQPAVQEAILNSVKFWLDLGVDGFRLDTANFYAHDTELRNNPGRGVSSSTSAVAAASNPYAWQDHVYDKNRPETLVFMQRLRALTDQYPDTTMVGEIGDEAGISLMAQYTAGSDKLHMAYCFDLLAPQHDAAFLRGRIELFEQLGGTGWPCWAISNHDVTRVATRWGGAQPDPRAIKMAASMLLSLRGSVCLYQGEELGLPEAELSFEQLQDPYGITMWPEFKGRDGCRTPMPWRHDQQHADFTKGSQSWLPVPAEHQALAVDMQDNDPDSILSHYRRMLAWRRTQPALVLGGIRLADENPQILAFVREHAGEQRLCIFNCGGETVVWETPEGLSGFDLMPGSPSQGAQRVGDAWHFEPWGVAFASPTDSAD
jgi:alpha-glucosidase